MKRRLYIAGGVLLALVAAYLAGRFSAPVEVKTVTKTERVFDEQAQAHATAATVDKGTERVRVVTITRTEPTGAKVETKTEDRFRANDLKLQSDWTGTVSTRESAKAAASTVSRSSRPGWSVSLAARADAGALSLKPEAYEVGIDRRLFGTVWVGVRADTEKHVGASLRLEF